MASPLEVVEGLRTQSADERIAYTITTTNWASDPTSPSAKVYDEDDDSDVTNAAFPTNSPTVSGDVITLSLLRNLTAGKTYRVEVQFTAGGNLFECYFRVHCER